MKQEDGKLVEDSNCSSVVDAMMPGMDHVTEVYEISLFQKHEDISELQVQNGYREILDMKNNPSPFKSELSRILPAEAAPKWFQGPKYDKEAVFERMRSKLVERDPIAPKKNEPVEHVKQTDIGGIPRGKLHVYRERYQKDGTIKYPTILRDRLVAGDRSFEEEYLAFLKSK